MIWLAEPLLVRLCVRTQYMRMGVYELLELGAPHYAMAAYVRLARDTIRPEVGAILNAVFRKLTRQLESNSVTDPLVLATAALRKYFKDGRGKEVVRDPMVIGLSVSELGTAFSFPDWLVARWVARYGVRDAALLMHHFNRRPAYGVRVNPLRCKAPSELVRELQELRVKATVSQYLPDDFMVVQQGLQTVLRQGLAAGGQCNVQDEATGLVVAMLDPQPGELVLDACAAPGGKTLYIATKMKAQGTILAADISAKKLLRLRVVAHEMGLRYMIRILTGDLRDLVAAPRKLAAKIPPRFNLAKEGDEKDDVDYLRQLRTGKSVPVLSEYAVTKLTQLTPVEESYMGVYNHFMVYNADTLRDKQAARKARQRAINELIS